MAGVKISNLPAATTPLSGTESVPVVQSGVTVKATPANINAVATYTGTGTGAVSRLVSSKLGDVVSVKDFGAVGNGVADDTAEVKNAVAHLASIGGGTLHFPKGNYLCTETIYLPWSVTLSGDGYYCGPLLSGNNAQVFGSCIIGQHTGAAIVSMKGSAFCSLQNISLYGSQAAAPKVGLCLGRSSGASAGRHYFEQLGVFGNFTKAAIYSIASEENVWINPHANVVGALATAQYTFYTSDADDLSVDTLTTGSNWNADPIVGINFLHQASVANSSAICINVRANTAGWSFKGGFTGMTSGATSQHVLINLADDGSNSTDFTFEEIGCEAVSNASPPTAVFRITTSVANATLKGLRIAGCSTGQDLAGTQYYLDVPGNVTLEKADVSGSQTRHPSQVYQLSNSKINLPDQDLFIRGYSVNSTISGKSSYRTSTAVFTANDSNRPVASNIVFTGSGANDLSISSTNGFTNSRQNVFVVAIDGTGAPNTFKWSKDGGATYTTGVAITAGTPQLLADGCRITIVTGTGHTMADQWVWTVDPFINRDTGIFNWTPTDASGAGLSFTVNSAQYTKVGRLVTVIGDITFPTTASGANAEIGGLPFPYLGLRAGQGKVNYATAGSAVGLYGGSNVAISSKFQFVNSSATPVTNASLSGAIIGFTFTYLSAY